MEGDLEHLHHTLLRKGLSQKRTVAVLWLATAFFCVVGCILSSATPALQILIAIVCGLAMLAILYKLGAIRPVLYHRYHSKKKTGKRIPYDASELVNPNSKDAQ